MRLLIQTLCEWEQDPLTEWSDGSFAFSKEGDLWFLHSSHLLANGEVSFEHQLLPSITLSVNLAPDRRARHVLLHIESPERRFTLEVTELYNILEKDNHDFLLKLAKPTLYELLKLKDLD